MHIVSDRELLNRAVAAMNAQGILIHPSGGVYEYIGHLECIVASGFRIGDDGSDTLNGMWRMDEVGNTFSVDSSAQTTLMFHIEILERGW